MTSTYQESLSVISPKVVKSLNAQGIFTVILALHESLNDKSVEWIDRLSFPVQVWTDFGSQEVERLKNHTMSDTKVIVLVPASTEHQRTVILEHLRRHVIYLSLVRLVFVLETADGLSYKEYPEVTCIVISLNATAADVPKTDFWNCTERSVVPADKLFVKNRPTAWTGLMHKTFVSDITSVASVPSVERAIETSEDLDRHASAGLILPCVIEHRYAHRKVTESGRGTLGTLNRLLEDCGPSCLAGSDGNACIRASRRGTHVFLDVSRADGRCRNNVPGISPGKDHFGNFFFGFFVSKAFPYIQEHGNLLSAIFQSGLYDATRGELDRKNRSPFVNEEEVWTRFGSQEVERLKNHTMSDTKVIVLVPASTEHQRTVILEHLRRHVIYLSLVRLLFVLETADGLPYKEYPESEITSVANVPSIERAIETTEDVDRHARAGLILPCVIEHKYAHRKVTESGRGTLGTLNRLLEDCGPSCLAGRDVNACIRASRRGTHVFLDVSEADGSCRNNVPGVSPGKDHFGDFFFGFFVSKAFPYIQEHGNLLSAIFQSGLYDATRGAIVRNSVLLHGDVSARPYKIGDFRAEMERLGVIGRIEALGAYQMNHLWMVTFKTEEAKLRLVTAKELEDLTREKWKAEGFIGVQSTTRLVRLSLKEGVTLERIPHQLRIAGGNVLVVIPGRDPLCLRCKGTGHIRRECRVPRCDECHRFGHERDNCVRTYATVTQEVVADGDGVLNMDEEEAEEAARDVETEVSATVGAKEAPVDALKEVHPPQLQP
ncbi:hypothetical protein ISCGN_006598 [Ixodes scapularis]